MIYEWLDDLHREHEGRKPKQLWCKDGTKTEWYRRWLQRRFEIRQLRFLLRLESKR